MNEAKSYGITLQQNILSEHDKILEALKISGYCIIPNALSLEELETARMKLDAIYKQQEQEFGKENLKLINENNLVRCPLAYDDFFLYTVATNPVVIPVIEKVLGSFFIMHLQNGVINIPNEEHHQSSWHRDLPYQNFVISKPLAIGALYCIDPFTEETGCTWIVPFTHQAETIPSNEYIESHKIPLTAEPGSVILFDAMLLHKAGYNSSKIIRRAINNVYTTPILKQQISLPDMLGNKYENDSQVNALLGYTSQVSPSVKSYRERRLQRIK